MKQSCGHCDTHVQNRNVGAAQAGQAEKQGGETVGNLHGRIGGVVDGSDIHCEIAGGNIRGRFGGDVLGKDVVLSFDGRKLSGRYGGLIDGKDINAEIAGNRLFGRIGGLIGGADIDLFVAGDRVRGRVGGPIVGFDCDVIWGEDGTLGGRFGGALIGHDFSGEFHDIEPLLAVAIAAIVYYQDRLEHSHHSSQSGHS